MKNRITLQGSLECDTHLKCDTIYTLKGKVTLCPGKNLKIDPGTIIEADTTCRTSLRIEPGSKIEAEGTCECPIIFTSASRCPKPGDWDGIHIEGYGEIDVQDISLRIQDSGCCITDSGILKYVIIEYAGTRTPGSGSVDTQCVPGNGAHNSNAHTVGTGSILPTAALTLKAVTDCTEISYVQVSYAGSDSFKFLGGNVNANHLVSYKPISSGLICATGYTGHIQFFFNLHDDSIERNAVAIIFKQDDIPLTPEAIENGTGVALANIPTHATLSHATVIGPYETNQCFNEPCTAILIADESLGEIHNSIFTGYQVSLVLGGFEGEFNLQNNIFTYILSFIVNVGLGGTDTLFTFNANKNTPSIFGDFDEECYAPEDVTPLNHGATYTPSGMVDPSIKVVKFRGAFGKHDWTQGWVEYVPCH